MITDYTKLININNKYSLNTFKERVVTVTAAVTEICNKSISLSQMDYIDIMSVPHVALLNKS